MDEKPLMSWPVLFGVTACSCLAFSLIIKLMDGDHSPLFLKIGLLAGICWALNRVVAMVRRTSSKKTQHS